MNDRWYHKSQFKDFHVETPTNFWLGYWDPECTLRINYKAVFRQCSLPKILHTRPQHQDKRLLSSFKNCFNFPYTGMFPVRYDTCNWEMLGKFLQGPNREKIPVLTRAKLLHDSWNLAYAGDLCFAVAFNMTLFLKNERSHVVWEPVFTMIDHVGRRIEGSDVHTKFEVYYIARYDEQAWNSCDIGNAGIHL